MATSKTLRVCLSKDLPDILDREPNFLYFLYDKLMLFMGQNIYNDPFCIVPALPDDPISGMLYIDFGDGRSIVPIITRNIYISWFTNIMHSAIYLRRYTNIFMSKKIFLKMNIIC